MVSSPAPGERERQELYLRLGIPLSIAIGPVSTERAQTTIDGSVIGQDASTGELVCISDQSRTKGLYIIGKPGMGKSSLLEDLIVQDMDADKGICLLDPHGDLVEHVLGRVPDHRADDVVLIDITDTERYAGLNLFVCEDLTDVGAVTDATERVFHVFERLWGPHGESPSWGPQLEEILRAAIYTLVKHPGMTMAEIPRLLTDDDFMHRLANGLNDEEDADVKAFWLTRYGAMSEAQRLSFSGSTRNKLSRFLQQPMVKYVVGQSRSTVDFRIAMDEGQIVLVKLDASKREVTSLIGSLVVGLIFAAAVGRPEGHRRQFNLYADEFPFFATRDFAELIVQARKFGIATTLAHQTRGQVKRADDAVADATLAMGNLVVFQVQHKDAEELAREFDSTPRPGKGQLVADPMRALESRGHPNASVMDAFLEVTRLLLTIERSLEFGDHLQREAERDQAHHNRQLYGPYAQRSWSRLPTAKVKMERLEEELRQYLYRSMREGRWLGVPEDALLKNTGGYEEQFRAAVYWLAEELAAAPLEVAGSQSGSSSPGARREELKNELTNLRRYRARVKVLNDDRTVEHLVETPPFHPPSRTPATLAAVAAIRARSRERDSRPKAVIDAEIRNRLRPSLRHSAPVEDEARPPLVQRPVAEAVTDPPDVAPHPPSPPPPMNDNTGRDRYEPL